MSDLEKKITPSTVDELEAAIHDLNSNAIAWLQVSIPERITLLEHIIREFGMIMETWVEQSLAAKEASDDLYATGMEWVGGPMAVLRYLRGLCRSLNDIHSHGAPSLPGPPSITPQGQVIANIYPDSLYESIVTPGVRVDLIMEKGITPETLPNSQAVYYRQPPEKGKVALVLGAGNVAGIPVLDMLFKLFIENQVVILKMNPVNEYLGPLIEKSHHELVRRNFLRVVYGGAKVGAYLANHPSINEIHLTGSDKTYEAIVFGSGEEGRRRKQEHLPLVQKRFTSELGSIGPAIIIPGPWSPKQIRYQAEQIISHLCDNASYSCSRTRVILTHSAWDLHDPFINEIRHVLAEVPSRSGYYPGARELYSSFLLAHPEAEKFGADDGSNLPWAFIPAIDSNQADDICFRVESFCPVISETSIPAENVPDFINKAVDFANNKLWGTLAATIIVHPDSLKDPEIATAVEQAIANLRYGQVVINGIGGMPWAMTTPPWGSFPGNDMYDIQSGQGFANNVFMFSRPEKVVVRAPFIMWPPPIWFNSRAKTFANVTRKVAYYDLNPSFWKIPGIVLAAM